MPIWYWFFGLVFLGALLVVIFVIIIYTVVTKTQGSRSPSSRRERQVGYDWSYEPGIKKYNIALGEWSSLSDVIKECKFTALDFYALNRLAQQGYALPEVMDVYVLHFSFSSPVEEILGMMFSRGFVPAGLPHLLLFGAAHIHEWTKYPVVALGEVWTPPNTDMEIVPVLWADGPHRLLKVEAYKRGRNPNIYGGWSLSYGFLALKAPNFSVHSPAMFLKAETVAGLLFFGH